MNEIYAKSATDSVPAETLLEHTRNCLSVLRSLRQAMPYLPQLCGEPDLWTHLFYCVYLHDLGKAATGFQIMLGDRNKKWGYRHEILSAGFVKFLNGLDETPRKTIMLAVITHHKTTDILKSTYNSKQNPQGWQLKRDELEANFSFAQQWLQNLPSVAIEYSIGEVPTPSQPQTVQDVEDAYSQAVWYFYKNQDEFCTPYATLLRGLVVACDHLASGGKAEVLSGVNDLVARLKIEARPFQREVGSFKGNVLLSAPTGSGKTEAALMWAAFQQDSGRRIFYVLPYTASINAMQRRFADRYDLKDYVGVLHGKASYFLYQDLSEKDDLPEDERAQLVKETQGLARKIYKPIKVLTPFQIIKTFFGVRGWEMQWAELCGGLFIFDEIHVYDARTTALLLASLEKLASLNARFLFMSATFPDFLKQKLQAVIPNLTEKTLDIENIGDRALLENPRHQVIKLEGEIIYHLGAIRNCIADGQKVLVVCNTVNRAQEVFKELRQEIEYSIDAALLHGRFILRDREEIESRLADVKLLVGTQAVEVSLDLSFDTIFTEPAPLDALIQRFGRVNRSGEKGIVPVHICTQGSDKDRCIYDVNRINRTMDVLQEGDLLSQIKVTQYINAVYEQGYNAKEQQIFNDTSTAFRDLIDGLVPFTDSGHTEEFYDLIQSFQVVPRAFEEEYLSAMLEKKYFDAMKYLATVTLGQGMKLKSLEALPKREIQWKSKSKSYYVANVDYDEELGLLLDQVNMGGVFID